MIGQKTQYNEYQNLQINPERLLISNQVKRKILYCVIAAHLLFLLFVFVIPIITEWLKSRKPKIIKVKLVSLPQMQEAARSLPAPPKPTPPKPTPPKPTPPKKKKIPPKKPTPPKKPVKKPSPKKKVVPPKKKSWKALNPADIKVAETTVKARHPSPPVKTPKFSAKSLRNKLNNVRSKFKITHKSSTTAPPVAYFDNVSAYIYQRWNQPGHSELGGRKPTVTVHVSIDASGKIRSSRISRTSGVTAMDGSVRRLLTGLSSLPKPPQGAIQFDIVLEIIDR